jgi:hypothetical protein
MPNAVAFGDGHEAEAIGLHSFFAVVALLLFTLFFSITI